MTLDLDLQQAQDQLNRAIILKIHYASFYTNYKDDVKAFDIKVKELKKKIRERLDK